MESTDNHSRARLLMPGSVDQGLVARIDARLRVVKLSEREASKRANLGLSFINDIKKGRSKEPSAEKLRALAEVLECTPAFLLGLEPDSGGLVNDEARSFAAVGSEDKRPHGLINLYASKSISDGLWVETAPGAVDKVPVIPPLAHVAGAYAWSVSTRHMEPRYYVGEVVYLHPGLIPRVGDFVFVRQTNGLATVARLREMGDEVTFEYLTGEKSTLPASEIAVIHRIVGSAG